MLWTISPAPEVEPVIVYEQLGTKALAARSGKALIIATHLLLHSSLFAPVRDGPADQRPLQEAASCSGSTLLSVASDSRLPLARRVVVRAEIC